MSATPWSLLTKTSRFPTERIGHNIQTGKIEFIHEITQERNYADPSNFFHVKWSMAHKKEYEQGRKVRLQVRLFKISTYRKIVSSNTSRIEAHVGLFR